MRHALLEPHTCLGIVIGAWARSQGERQAFGSNLSGYADAEEGAHP